MNLLNGVFRLLPTPGGGTTVDISVPANADPAIPALHVEGARQLELV
jgi:hypothetical protein